LTWSAREKNPHSSHSAVCKGGARRAAGVSPGPLVRGVRARQYPDKTPEALSERMVWHVVMKYARAVGIERPAPHDLPRTCAKLCWASAGELEQIQFLLGNASIQTTERYLGTRQNLKEAVNDRLGLEE
jgi:integrase/recombinase XerD